MKSETESPEEFEKILDMIRAESDSGTVEGLERALNTIDRLSTVEKHLEETAEREREILEKEQKEIKESNSSAKPDKVPKPPKKASPSQIVDYIRMALDAGLDEKSIKKVLDGHSLVHATSHGRASFTIVHFRILERPVLFITHLSHKDFKELPKEDVNRFVGRVEINPDDKESSVRNLEIVMTNILKEQHITSKKEFKLEEWPSVVEKIKGKHESDIRKALVGVTMEPKDSSKQLHPITFDEFRLEGNRPFVHIHQFPKHVWVPVDELNALKTAMKIIKGLGNLEKILNKGPDGIFDIEHLILSKRKDGSDISESQFEQNFPEFLKSAVKEKDIPSVMEEFRLLRKYFKVMR